MASSACQPLKRRGRAGRAAARSSPGVPGPGSLAAGCAFGHRLFGHGVVGRAQAPTQGALAPHDRRGALVMRQLRLHALRGGSVELAVDERAQQRVGEVQGLLVMRHVRLQTA
jgi:hypothetical protein